MNRKLSEPYSKVALSMALAAVVAFCGLHNAFAADQKSKYKETESDAISYFERLQNGGAAIGNAATPTPPPPLSAAAIDYLAAAYYLCALDNQSCEYFPASIIESDVVAARLTKKYQCPTMLNFWKVWAERGYETKLDQLIKTGRLYRYDHFRKFVRSQYVSCSAFVRSEVSSGRTQRDYFALRYAQGSAAIKSISTLTAYLKRLQKNVPDVYAAGEKAFSEAK